MTYIDSNRYYKITDESFFCCDGVQFRYYCKACEEPQGCYYCTFDYTKPCEGCSE